MHGLSGKNRSRPSNYSKKCFFRTLTIKHVFRVIANYGRDAFNFILRHGRVKNCINDRLEHYLTIYQWQIYQSISELDGY